MKNEEIKRQFVAAFFDGDVTAYRKARKDDYCKIQEAWSFYIDSLCRDGIITQSEYEKATF